MKPADVFTQIFLGKHNPIHRYTNMQILILNSALHDDSSGHRSRTSWLKTVLHQALYRWEAPGPQHLAGYAKSIHPCSCTSTSSPVIILWHFHIVTYWPEHKTRYCANGAHLALAYRRQHPPVLCRLLGEGWTPTGGSARCDNLQRPDLWVHQVYAALPGRDETWPLSWSPRPEDWKLMSFLLGHGQNKVTLYPTGCLLIQLTGNIGMRPLS
jgi:hypothetical protein